MCGSFECPINAKPADAAVRENIESQMGDSPSIQQLFFEKVTSVRL